MSLLLDLLGVLVFVVVAPYLVIAHVVAKSFIIIEEAFYVPLLALCASTAALAAMTWAHSTSPDSSREFATLIEVVSQAHVAGIAVPVWLTAIAALLGLAASSKTWKSQRTDY